MRLGCSFNYITEKTASGCPKLSLYNRADTGERNPTVFPKTTHRVNNVIWE